MGRLLALIRAITYDQRESVFNQSMLLLKKDFYDNCTFKVILIESYLGNEHTLMLFLFLHSHEV